MTARDLFLLRRVSLRHWSENWGQYAILLLVFAIGVASFFSIRIANRAVLADFSQFAEVVSRQSDFTLHGPPGGIAQQRLGALREALGHRPAHLLPVLETTTLILRPFLEPDTVPAPAYLTGLDLMALGNLATDSELESALNESSATPDSEFRTSTGVWCSADLARDYGLHPGDSFDAIVNDHTISLHVEGVLPAATNLNRRLLVSLNDLQVLLDQPDRVDRVEVFIPTGSLREYLYSEIHEILSAQAGNYWSLEEAEAAGPAGQRMTRAFRLNLTILSLIALVVAAYLIMQAMDAAVVRRRLEIAILRSIGMSSVDIRRMWRVESIAFATVGSLLGVLLGWFMAQFTVTALAQTTSALYASTAPASAHPNWTDMALALAIGLVSIVISAWVPIRDATNTPPAQQLQRGNYSAGLQLLQNPKLGLLLVAAGAVLWPLPPLDLGGGTRFPVAGFGVAFCWITGGSFLAGSLLRYTALAAHQGRQLSASLRLAISHLAQSSSRHRLAAAGLYTAIAMAFAVTLLVHSFEVTVLSWLDLRFRADLYATSVGLQTGDSRSRIPESTLEAIRKHPSVEELDALYFAPMRLRGFDTHLASMRFDLIGNRQKLSWLEPPGMDLASSAETHCIVNESFYRRFGTPVGAVLSVPTPQGPLDLTIAGIQKDYGNERGSVYIDRRVLNQHFGILDATHLILFLHPEAHLPNVLQELRSEHPYLSIRANRELREAAVAIFHDTFAVTQALKWIGVAVALIGLSLTVFSILRERAASLQALTVMGMSRRSIARSVAWEMLGLAAAATLAAAIAGLALGLLLVYVINLQSFGWTLDLSVPLLGWSFFGGTVVALGGATAYLAGLHGVSRPSTSANS